MTATDLLGGSGPRWFTIAAHRPFVEDLARGLADNLLPGGPEALAEAIVLTPTRRGARALAQAFLAVTGGKAVLLPQIRALGDLDEGEPPFEPGEIGLNLPPAVSPYRRRFELARLVIEHGHLLEREIDAAGALELGDALAAFLDSLQIEEAAGADRIEALVEGDLARHWRISARFLGIAVSAWPKRLKALGLIDVNERRVRLLNLLERQWAERPPATPLIAAGSTGAAPATARLLATVAQAPRGAVVLPGLDLELAEAAWGKVDDQHPQGAMKRLLERSGIDRHAVRPWPVASSVSETQGRWRRRLINEALRPADETADWRAQIAHIRTETKGGEDPIAIGLRGLTVAAGRNEAETASLAALLMRETMETPDKTCALITPDRDLARRVCANLARWGLEIDSSAGVPLTHADIGVLLDLLARAAADGCDPVLLLAILKHPLVRLGRADGAGAHALAELERLGLRGPRAGDWEALKRRLGENAAAVDLLTRIRAILEPICRTGDQSVADHASAIAKAIEALAADPDGRTGRLWAGAGGEAAAELIGVLMNESEALPPASPAGFADLLYGLMAGVAVRAGGGHPRLSILGAIEARLVRADRLILAGLEEGVWPQAAAIDPFLSRPMRSALGLPPPERRIGLSAHDFAQAASAPEVYLLHSERLRGAPAVQSRWMWRLKALAAGAGLELPTRPELTDWVRALDRPQDYRPIARAAFAPPLEARPLKLAVTQVEALTRDPYAVYARQTLKLFRLNRPDEPLEQRARGSAIHAAFERFSGEWPAPNAAERFAELYLEELVKAGAPLSALAREQALAVQAGAWVADFETRRRWGGARILVEQSGRIGFATGRGDFVLTAKADRIELTPEGLAHVLDFKTGAPPSKKMVGAGFSPQLTLTAAIIARGGFEGLPTAAAGDLAYVRITGREPAGDETVVLAAGPESHDGAERALEGLKALIAHYENPAAPFRSRTAPQFVKTYASDYDHLARVFEWSTGGGEDGE